MLVVLILLLATNLFAGDRTSLHAEFIGNEAFRITDGNVTLFTDFPYESGAFGYMKYDDSKLQAVDHSYCLFTHAHSDHFNAALLSKIGCTVIGPESVLTLAKGSRTIALSKEIDLNELTITPMKTDHGVAEHYSYLVEWHGKRLYFSGDTESTSELKSLHSVDVLFVTPWLWKLAQAQNALPAAKRMIIYHHRAGEKVDSCSRCIVPTQAQAFDF